MKVKVKVTRRSGLGQDHYLEVCVKVRQPGFNESFQLIEPQLELLKVFPNNLVCKSPGPSLHSEKWSRRERESRIETKKLKYDIWMRRLKKIFFRDSRERQADRQTDGEGQGVSEGLRETDKELDRYLKF